MRLIILDAGLKGRGGHHYAFDLAVGTEAKRRGVEVLCLAHEGFDGEGDAPFEIRPVFTRSPYDRVSRDLVTAAHEAYVQLNPRFQRELTAISDLFTPGDLVWVPTTTENHLKGLLDWIQTLDPARAPRFVVTLLMPAGVIAGSDPVVVDPIRALHYRMQLARTPPSSVTYVATGRQIAADFSYLAQRPIETHPLLVADTGPLTPASERCVLLYAGESSPQKGVTLLPELVQRLGALLPGWRLLVHANDSTYWQTKAPVRELEALRASVPNLDLRTGYLDEDAYTGLLREAAAVLMPYNQRVYRNQTSGVLWEAIHAGRPVIVPRGTYLEREAQAWGTSYASVDTQDAQAAAAEVANALTANRLNGAVAMAAAQRFREGNGLQPFVDRLLSLGPGS